MNNKSNTKKVHDVMRGVFEEAPVARQSFEEARKKLSHTAFEELFEDSVSDVLAAPEAKLYKGKYRVLAEDGSLVELPKSEALREAFGKSTPSEEKTFARIAFLADVLNGFIVAGDIEGFDVGERELANRHVENVKCDNGLFMYDRGYWQPELIKSICTSGRKFLIRIPSNGISAVTKSKESSGTFLLDGECELRFHNFKLPSGDVEYLVTNLDSGEVSDAELEELYALRWGVETRYNEFKHELEFIKFMGKSELIVKQDFFALLTVMNLIAASMYDAEELVQERMQGKTVKYQQKPNKTVAINTLKTWFLRAVIESDPRKKDALFEQLIEDIARYTVPVRPGRHVPRPGFPKRHGSRKKKANVSK